MRKLGYEGDGVLSPDMLASAVMMNGRFFPFPASSPGLQSLAQRMYLAASAAKRDRMRGKRTAHGRHRSAAEALQRPVLRYRQHLRLR
jgi:hypothetical protein